MKAEERHRLKTNELAQKLSELPDYLRKHSKYITIGIAVVVVVCVAGGFWWSARKKGQQSRNEELQSLFPQITQVQILAVRVAQDPGAKPTSGTSYNTSSVLGSLQNLSTDAKGTGVGMTALLQQAELKRSELYYTNRELTDAMRDGICREAETLYNQILQQYGDHAVAVGTAKLGLALVAEDRGQWDKAKKAYQEILAEQAGKLAGTTYPLQAKRRLRKIDEIAIEIDFPYIEPVEEIIKPTTTSLLDAEGSPGKPSSTIEPIKIEIPEAPKPKLETEVKPIGPVLPEDQKEKTTEEPLKDNPPQPEKQPSETEQPNN
jgi:hypothetical protein